MYGSSHACNARPDFLRLYVYDCLSVCMCPRAERKTARAIDRYKLHGSQFTRMVLYVNSTAQFSNYTFSDRVEM